ncbi:hypothetical protein ACX9NE_11815 [Mycobacterium sp. ML4]
MDVRDCAPALGGTGQITDRPQVRPRSYLLPDDEPRAGHHRQNAAEGGDGTVPEAMRSMPPEALRTSLAPLSTSNPRRA